jgi:hypothetical protein
LQTLNYTVQCGTILFPVNTQTNSCNNNGGGNPSSCYGVLQLPPRTGGTRSGKYQLDDDEAVVTIGIVPPLAYYYGYQTYLFSRANPLATTTVSLDASVGPAINQDDVDPWLRSPSQVIKAQMFAPQNAFLVSTANKVTQKDIASALPYYFNAPPGPNDVTNARKITNFEKLPVDLLQLGSSGTADLLQTYIRLTPFSQPTQPGQFDDASMLYMGNPELVILRVSPNTPRTGIPWATYKLTDDPLPPTKIQTGQVFEQTLLTKAEVSDANAALQAIVNNVTQDRVGKGKKLQKTVYFSALQNFQGRSCIQVFNNNVAVAKASSPPDQSIIAKTPTCAGDSPDADYFGVSATLPAGGEIVVVGINHGTLGSGVYSNIAIQQPSQYGKALTNADLDESATAFLGRLPLAVASDFYVASLSNNCAQGGPYCIPAPENTPLQLVERVYLSPVTATKPDYTDIIPSVVLVFQ